MIVLVSNLEKCLTLNILKKDLKRNLIGVLDKMKEEMFSCSI